MARTTDSNTVILIDDEPHNMLWLSDYLEARGMKVIVAETVNEALDIIGKKIFRVLVIDLNIPVLPPLEDEVRSAGGREASSTGTQPPS